MVQSLVVAPRLELWVLAAFLVSITGCGDDGNLRDSGGVDGGADTGAPDVGLSVAQPIIPWLDEGAPPDVLLPCPEGWREVVVDGVTECDPYPEGGPGICGAGEAHFLGEPTCQPIGAPCPADDFSAALPTDGSVIYVKAGAPPGGDGSLTSPYAELSELSWLSLRPGTTVALAKGTYEGSMPLRPGVRVVGACTAETILVGTVPIVRAVVMVTGAGEAPVVRNIWIRNAPQAGALVNSGRSLTLEGVLIDTATTSGVSIANPDTSVTLRNVVIRNTTPRPSDGDLGRGIEVSDGGRLDAQRLVIDRCHDMGLLVLGAGSRAMLTDAVIADTRANAGLGGNGMGIVALSAGEFDAQRLLVRGNMNAGIFILGTGSAASLSDTIVQDTQPHATTGGFGIGIDVQGGGQLDAQRLLIRRNRDYGVSTSGTGSRTTLAGGAIRDTMVRESDDRSGVGILADRGSHLDARRLVVQGSQSTGIQVDGAGASGTLLDVVVRDTTYRGSTDLAGIGVLAVNGSQLDAERLLIEECDLGILDNHVGTHLTLFDTVVRSMRAVESSGELGRGITVQDGARLDADRLRVERVRELGIVVVDGSIAEVRDVTITETLRAECATTSCPDVPYGYAAVAVDAALSLTRFEIRDAATCGVFVASEEGTSETALYLESGIVTGAVIGACIQIDGYDLDRLTSDVRYVDNGSNLEATMLPVP